MSATLRRKFELVWIDLMTDGMEPINVAINAHVERLTVTTESGIHVPTIHSMCHHASQDVLLLLCEVWYLANE